MSADENKRIARRHYESISDLAAAFELIAPEVQFYGMPGVPPTYEGWHQAHTMFLAAFPDMQLRIEDEIAEGDTVVTRWTMAGTNRGPLMGMAATGKRVTIGGISIDRIGQGKVVEHRVAMDQLGMMQQLGVIPAPG